MMKVLIHQSKSSSEGGHISTPNQRRMNNEGVQPSFGYNAPSNTQRQIHGRANAGVVNGGNPNQNNYRNMESYEDLSIFQSPIRDSRQQRGNMSGYDENGMDIRVTGYREGGDLQRVRFSQGQAAASGFDDSRKQYEGGGGQRYVVNDRGYSGGGDGVVIEDGGYHEGYWKAKYTKESIL